MSVEIRLATPDDAAGILKIYSPYCESSHVSFEIIAPHEAEMRERIAHIMDQHPWLVASIDDEVAGYVYASQHRARAAYRWAVDVAVYVGRAHHRRGLGRALYTTLFALLRQQGYFKAYAGITLPNPASVGLHESLGFQSVAVYPKVGYKLGRWLDVGWWQLNLQAEVDNPPEPRGFPAIRGSGALDSVLAAGAALIGRQSL
jgi:phosphinothricin acetyltransferase